MKKKILKPKVIPEIKLDCTQVTDDVTDDTPGDTGEVKQEAESEPQTEATETSAEEHESKEEANMEAAESSEAPEAVEGDLPEEEVTHLLCPSVCNPGVAQVC